MWLSDYEMAIAAMRDVFQDACFEQISCSFDGSVFIFEPVKNGDYSYIYFRKTGRIEMRPRSSWRDESLIQVIRDGN